MGKLSKRKQDGFIMGGMYVMFMGFGCLVSCFIFRIFSPAISPIDVFIVGTITDMGIWFATLGVLLHVSCRLGFKRWKTSRHISLEA